MSYHEASIVAEFNLGDPVRPKVKAVRKVRVVMGRDAKFRKRVMLAHMKLSEPGKADMSRWGGEAKTEQWHELAKQDAERAARVASLLEKAMVA